MSYTQADIYIYEQKHIITFMIAESILIVVSKSLDNQIIHPEIHI